MTKKMTKFVSSCNSCTTKEQASQAKRIFPKFCIGHIMMGFAFIYIALSQILL